MSGSDSMSKALLASMERIERLLTALTRQALAATLESELADPKARAVYDATGARTTREIAEATGLALATISKLWNRWESLGLVTRDGQRYRRVIDGPAPARSGSAESDGGPPPTRGSRSGRRTDVAARTGGRAGGRVASGG
jgi:hypothetical protein